MNKNFNLNLILKNIQSSLTFSENYENQNFQNFDENLSATEGTVPSHAFQCLTIDHFQFYLIVLLHKKVENRIFIIYG